MKKNILLLISILWVISIQAQTKVTLCWDVSFSMKDRSLQAEYEFLDDYFVTNPNVNVTLLLFNSRIISKDDFSILSGQWDLLKNELSNSIYDGTTSYQFLKENTFIDTDILLFTDGKQLVNSTIPNLKGDLIVINANNDFEEENLAEIARVSHGKYLNLIEKESPLQTKGILYSGTVYESNIPIEGVEIEVKGDDANHIIYTKQNGKYTILANKGKVLIYKLDGVKVFEKTLDSTGIIDVWLKEIKNVEKLDEVIITAQSKNNHNENIGLGLIEKRSREIGFAVQTLQQSDMIQGVTTLDDAVRGKFIGVNQGINEALSRIVIRGHTSFSNQSPPLIIVDGLQYNGVDTNGRLDIDPNTVASVTALKGLSATARYGSKGISGVFVITTKVAAAETLKKNSTKSSFKKKKKKKSKRIKTAYLKELKKAKGLEKAYKVYLLQRSMYWNTPEYLIDVYNFFKKNDEGLAFQVLSNILEKKEPSLAELKAMLFALYGNDYSQIRLDIANRILNLFPHQIQSYVDVALANKELKNYETALNMFITIADGTINPKLDFSPLKLFIESEIKNMVYKHKKVLDLTSINPKYSNNKTSKARLIFDWNDNYAEFEIHILSPEKKGFIWAHTNSVNTEKIKEELITGYSKKVIELEGENAIGEWFIDVRYFGKRFVTNSSVIFLKCTVQYNFGMPNQRDEEHLIRLQNKGDELLTVLDVN